MKKLLIGFILGIVFTSAISFAAFTYKKTIFESWNGMVSPGERIIVVDSKCTKVTVLPALSKIIDIKTGATETLKVTMTIQK
jgi:hypothetical protein